MAQAIFDKDGNITNLDELTPAEIDEAHKSKKQEIFGRMSDAKNAEQKAKEELDEYKRTHPDAPAPSITPTIDPTRIDKLEGDMTDAKLARLGHDDATIAFIRTYARGAGKDPAAVLDDEMVKEFITSRKAKINLQNQTPSPSSRTAAPLPPDWDKKSPAEKQDWMNNLRKQKIGK